MFAFEKPESAGEKQPETNTTEKATLGGGCFWCLEAIYERAHGVKDVVSGYAGGSVANPHYKQVARGETGHAEVVQIKYDPKETSYEELLDLFWQAHDPTTLNRQGSDVGTQYRSIVLYHNEKQKAEAEASKAQAGSSWNDPIVTEIKELDTFYPAEVSHQDYYRLHPRAPYCQWVIAPKLKKLKGKLSQ